MPYFGLLDKDFQEIKTKGYYRRDLSDIHFKVSPSKEKENFIFINVSPIEFHFEGYADVVGIGVFEESDSKHPIVVCKFDNGIKTIARGDLLVISPGGIEIPTTITKTSAKIKRKINP
jgi:hypothetical protein